MRKYIIACAFGAAMFAMSPAYADSPAVAMDCGHAVRMFGRMLSHMPANARRAKAMKEMAMAKTAMEGHHMKACMVHIGQIEQVYSGG